MHVSFWIFSIGINITCVGIYSDTKLIMITQTIIFIYCLFVPAYFCGFQFFNSVLSFELDRPPKITYINLEGIICITHFGFIQLRRKIERNNIWIPSQCFHYIFGWIRKKQQFLINLELESHYGKQQNYSLNVNE